MFDAAITAGSFTLRPPFIVNLHQSDYNKGLCIGFVRAISNTALWKQINTGRKIVCVSKNAKYCTQKYLCIAREEQRKGVRTWKLVNIWR